MGCRVRAFRPFRRHRYRISCLQCDFRQLLEMGECRGIAVTCGVSFGPSASELPNRMSVQQTASMFPQHFGLVLRGIVDRFHQQRQSEPAVPVADVAAIDICDRGVDANADGAAAADHASAAVDVTSIPHPSSSTTYTAGNIISLLQSFHESMASAPDGIICCADFISSFLFDCMLHVDWASLPSSSASWTQSSCPGRCAIIAASQPLLQVKLCDLLLTKSQH